MGSWFPSPAREGYMKRLAWLVLAAPSVVLLAAAAPARLAAPAPPAGPEAKLSERLRASMRAERPEPVWVFLRDKGPASALTAAETRRILTPRALSRRALRRGPVGLGDTDRPVF